MPYTKAVITDIYFDCPIWIENDIARRKYLCLTSDCSTDDVALFLMLLFGYNNIDSKLLFKKAFNELFSNEEIAISGGIAFFEDENNFILPSCCCGLENWQEIEMSIHNKSSPWLGHDPTPGFIYGKDQLIVWSDDPEKNDHDLLNIKYSYKEIFKCLEKTKFELKEFIQKPLYNWINSKDRKIAEKMNQMMKKWILKDD
jgi:hypothetical protein